MSVLHDSPKTMYRDESVQMCDYYAARGMLRNVVIPNKSGCARMINLCIAMAPSDWVLVCIDDIVFKEGWLDYLEQKIAEGRHRIVTLFNYGAAMIHKSMMLKIGWFDERFLAGGYEDNDFQLRISEAGARDLVDSSHDFIEKKNDVEIGHFVDHTKYVWNDVNGWDGPPNGPWFCAKWGRPSTPFVDFRSPFYRKAPEIDWHPYETVMYMQRFNMKREWSETTKNSMESCRGINN
jgi:glycosyltransferase involved in cell wall biosynthesis